MTQVHTDADAFVSATIRDCLAGTKVSTDKDVSWEQLYYQATLQFPRNRVFAHFARPLNPVVAVARFAWLVAGNNRVEDIAFYEPKVRSFSDDGLTVPGSDYGHRLFQPRPGLDQIQGVVDRLRANPGSRQAAAVVWQPEDAVRASGDIPCTHGLFFHIRDHRDTVGPELQMAVTMRSNNAFRILPFNVFEFTLLQELVATELDTVMGDYTVWAASMHVYENEREWESTKTVGNSVGNYHSLQMPRMPKTPGLLRPMRQAREFAMVEGVMRHCVNERQLVHAWETNHLDPYWRDLLAVLYAWHRAVRDLEIDWNTVPLWAYDGTKTAVRKLYEQNRNL